MNFVSDCKFASILGTMTVVKQISMKDKLLRKKYMGVWSLESQRMARMMSTFPSTVTRYMRRKMPKRGSCSCGLAERPRRMKPEVLLWFLFSMSLGVLVRVWRSCGSDGKGNLIKTYLLTSTFKNPSLLV